MSAPSPASQSATRPLDPMAETFLLFERRARVHSNQLALIDGDLPAPRLRAAIDRAAPLFPLLLAAADAKRRLLRLGAYRASDIRLREVAWNGPGAMDFGNRAFRRFVLDASQSDPPLWGEGPPARFLLFRETRAEAPRRSCVAMSVSHAVADALSDSCLLDAVARACAGLPLPETPAESPPIEEVAPAIFRGFWSPRRLFVGMAAGMRDMARRDVRLSWSPEAAESGLGGFPPGPDGVWNPPLDFHREALDDALRARLKVAAKRAGATLNALVSAAIVRLMRRQASPGDARRHANLTLAMGLRRKSAFDPAVLPIFGDYALPAPLRVAPRRLDEPAEALARWIAGETKRLREKQTMVEAAKMAFALPAMRMASFFPRDNWLMRRMFGSNVLYSNPGVVPHPFESFGEGLPIAQYAGLSTVMIPYVATLYTPQVGGRLFLNAIYRVDRFGEGFAARVVEPLKAELERLLEEMGA